MKKKIIDIETFKSFLKDDMRIMVGGFAGCGVPDVLIQGILESGVKNLTIISNDSTHPGEGISLLIANNQIKKLIASHIGMNPQTGEKYNSGELEVQLVPQGTLAESIRAAGAGLGGVLTKTGLGTEVAEGKETIVIDGETYLVEKPIHADMAVIRGSVVDEFGNTTYKGTTRNFNPVMATAADLVVAAAEKVVKIGELEKENIVTPGIFVDYIVGGEPVEFKR
ncbi:CoA transferase subunit A [Ihubacter massiliensis]|uniref:CoA transferase subunit A n=1 Tax=Hominibacterium faecale TaxID=2839743 RepID=A0A9J6QU95_9FIRM|nr:MULTISPECIES: CoA transferase subunit A [Eubacteriales Family XIII. Incertae Sedis]MCO7122928.1 CoA transferase subunit A [Ihubacter massiliensis]MCU7377190.1 CoA transferase subunit A [Hominibacterium faecale]